MTAQPDGPDRTVHLHLPSGRFAVPEDAARSLPQRLEQAARDGEVLVVPVLDDAGRAGVAVVPPGTAVVVTGPPDAFEQPAEGNPTW